MTENNVHNLSVPIDGTDNNDDGPNICVSVCVCVCVCVGGCIYFVCLFQFGDLKT